MQSIVDIFLEYWIEFVTALFALFAAGIWFKKTHVTQGEKSNFVDQSHSKSRGDMVGRDKTER